MENEAFERAALEYLNCKHGAEGEVKLLLSRRGFNGWEFFLQLLCTGGPDGHLFAVKMTEVPPRNADQLEIEGHTVYIQDGYFRPITRKE